MPLSTHEITRADVMNMDEYATQRPARRKAMMEIKKNRRLHIGPDATAYFENFDTMWHQVHEMLHIEKGGEDQIEAELRAYNALVPKGRELVCTLMFEIENAQRRETLLAKLGGVEKTVTLQFADETIAAIAETDVERTSATGKASSVQFLHFPFTSAQASAFKSPKTAATLAIDHDHYAHMVKMSKAVRKALAEDLD